MKKVLSLMVVFALILTTLALPMTASAFDIGLQAVKDAEIAITYVSDAQGDVHPGDTFNVTIKATPTEKIDYEAYELKIQYDESIFEITTAEDDGFKILGTDDKYISLINETGGTLAAGTATDLKTLTFKVKDTAAPAEKALVMLNTEGLKSDIMFAASNGDIPEAISVDNNRLTDTALNIKVVANTYKIMIDDNELVSGATYYKASVVVKVEATGLESATIQKDAEEATAIGTGYTASTDGTYTIKVKVKGGQEETKTFTLSTAAIDAKLDTALTGGKTAYKPNEEVSIPVTISGLSTAKAAMVKFKVDADAGLTLDEAKSGITADGVLQYKDGYIVYGDENSAAEKSLANKATVVTLVYTVDTVAADGTYTNKSVTISEPSMALETTAIDPTNKVLGITTATQNIVVVPEGAFATLPADIGTENWNNSPYTVDVTPVKGATVKYVAYDVATVVATATQDDLKAIYNTEGAENGSTSITVNSEKQYVAVAAIGSDPVEYQLVGTLVPGTNAWYDAAPPTVDASALAMTKYEDSKSGATLVTADKLKVEDNLSKAGKYEYKIGNTAYAEFDPADGITIPAGSYKDAKLTIRVTDKAGNVTESTPVTLKYDGDDPEITDSVVGEVKADASKDITATITDETTAVKAKLYYQAAADAALTDIAAIEALVDPKDITIGEAGAASIAVKTAGRYYIVAADEVGHKVYKSVEVTFETLAEASKIKVKVVKTASDFTADAFTTERDTNGSFTYVAVQVTPALTNYVNTVTLAKVGGAAADYTSETAIEAAGDYTLTVTTTHNINEADTKSAVYKFSIVGETDMPSPDNNKRFNIMDYAMVKVLTKDQTTGILPGAEHGFTGGVFSGDVNGDFTYDSADLALLIGSIRQGNYPGTYTFPILNK